MIAENTTRAGAIEGRPEHEDRRDSRGYGPGPLVRELTGHHGLRCWVSLPTGIHSTGERCADSAVVEVYGTRYCEIHGAEVRAGALAEMYFSASQDLERFDNPHVTEMDNRATMWALRKGASELTRRTLEAEKALDEALVAAFPFREEFTDPETLAFDWSDPGSLPPPEDWYRMPLLHTHKLMRLAHEEGDTFVLEQLEPLRQSTAAQLSYALQHARRKGSERADS